LQFHVYGVTVPLLSFKGHSESWPAGAVDRPICYIVARFLLATSIISLIKFVTRSNTDVES